MCGDYREVEVAHHGVVLGVLDLPLQQVEVGEPLPALHHVVQLRVLELDVQVVLEHAFTDKRQIELKLSSKYN